MSRPQLALVQNLEVSSPAVPFSQMLADHHAILQGYLDTHVTRNHSDRTIESERRFLTGWFESFVLQDDDHPDGERQLLLWEAMEPAQGRQRVVAFSKGLVDVGLKQRTVQGYLGFLRRLFQYVLDYPFIPGSMDHTIVYHYDCFEHNSLAHVYPVPPPLTS